MGQVPRKVVVMQLKMPGSAVSEGGANLSSFRHLLGPEVGRGEAKLKAQIKSEWEGPSESL